MADPTKPALSQGAIDEYRSLLARPDFERDYPDRYAALKASVDGALAVTGQKLDRPQVLPSPQQHHSEIHGVPHDPKPADYPSLDERGRKFAAALQLPAYMVEPLLREADGAKEIVEAAGHDYAKLVSDVDAFIKSGETRYGSQIPVKAEKLSANALVQLSVYAKHVAAMRSSQPKG